MELTKEEKNEVVQKIRDVSEHFLDIIDLTERAAAFKTRQYIKLTDVEIKKIKQDSFNAFIILIRNIMCYEKFIEKKGLKEESQDFIKLIVDRFKEIQKGQNDIDKQSKIG